MWNWSNISVKHSHLNTYRRLYILLSIGDCPEILSNDKVQKFMTLCHELFSLSGDGILTISLNQGDQLEFEKSVRSKSWGKLDNLRDETQRLINLEAQVILLDIFLATT